MGNKKCPSRQRKAFSKDYSVVEHGVLIEKNYVSVSWFHLKGTNNFIVQWPFVLVGESAAGKPNRSVAKLLPGPNADLQNLGTRATSASSEVSRAHMLMLERGEKLNRLEDNAEKMSNEAQQFSGTAHQLMNKYRDKKWYQL